MWMTTASNSAGEFEANRGLASELLKEAVADDDEENQYVNTSALIGTTLAELSCGLLPMNFAF
jgi:hypothetical protein